MARPLSQICLNVISEQTHDPRNEKITRIQLLSEHASLSFLTCSLYNKLFNKLLKVEHSLGDGYFLTDIQMTPITSEMTDQIRQGLIAILNSEDKIETVHVPRNELIGYFKERGFTDKLGLLKTWFDELIPCVKCGEFIDFMLEPISNDKERLKIFDIKQFENGFILRFPTLLCPKTIVEWSDPHALNEMFREYREWAKLIDCDTVSKLNDIIFQRKIDDIKWVAEGLHEQKLAKIAKYLVKKSDTKKVATVAGPSSSNKTTFALRLAIQLRVNGFTSIVISMDDYYKNRADIPFGADGLQDFESIDALNIPVLAERIKKMLNGESVPRRRFDFHTGVGYDDSKEMQSLPKNAFLIIEGIHGLNPILLNSIGSDVVVPIYVSALTPLHLDFSHRFPTSDLRLIRRIIRDYRYRNYSPRKTIRRWTSVRIGEERNIFPFQGNAELFFNSALVYELPVLSVQGKALLAEATMPEDDEDPNSAESKEVTKEARRLLGLLNFFYPASTEIVPHISCIREFVGGSDLKY